MSRKLCRVTNKVLLITVLHFHVTFQVVLVVTRVGAVGANKRFRFLTLDLLVAPQVPLLLVRLAALLAHETFKILG